MLYIKYIWKLRYFAIAKPFGKKMLFKVLSLSPLPKKQNQETPQRHDDTKFHKALLFNTINLVKL